MQVFQQSPRLGAIEGLAAEALHRVAGLCLWTHSHCTQITLCSANISGLFFRCIYIRKLYIKKKIIHKASSQVFLCMRILT